MDTKETKTAIIRSDILLHNDEYYKYVFKKTEKVLSAVFYTTRSLTDILQKDTLVLNVEDNAFALLKTLKRTLVSTRGEQIRQIEELRIGLIALEGALILLVAGRMLREEILDVFRHEITGLQRLLRDYSRETSRHPFEALHDGVERAAQSRPRQGNRSPKVVGTNEGASTETPLGVNRRERILDIIRAKGHVTIKDVSSAITDVSEKTIQRELMSLISDGFIEKEGERRWSKYIIKL